MASSLLQTPVCEVSAACTERRVLAVIRHPVGGIRTHILYTYPYLIEKGYTFTFVLPAIDEARVFRAEVEAWPGTEVVEAPMVGLFPSPPFIRPATEDVKHPQCMFVSTVRRLLRHRTKDGRRRFRLIHSQGIRAATQAVAANFGIGVPHLATSQDMVRREDFYGSPGGRGPARALKRLTGRLKLTTAGLLLSRLDALVTVSGDARQNHLHFFPRLRRLKHPVEPIFNGIDTRLFDSRAATFANDGELRRRLGIDCNVFLAGFLGRFMEQKGFLVLLDALERLVQQELPRPIHLVAMESGDFVREYSAIVRGRPRAASCITFLPREPNVAHVLRQLDALVMPSLWEACGILAMEAMAVGVPVIGSNCPGLREVLQGTPSRAVPPNDPGALAQALRDAMIAPRGQEAIAYADRARERFDARHTAESLSLLFENVHASRADKKSPFEKVGGAA